jgi:hypothetical protein
MHFINRWITIFCWICTFLCAGSLTKTFAGNSIADSLYRAGQYYDAAIEYEREGFVVPVNSTKTIALINKAKCLALLGKYEDGEHCLGRIEYSGLPDSLVYQGRYEYALCAYLGQDFGNAESQLLQLQFFVPDSMLTRESLPLFSLVLNELHKWEEAKQKLLNYVRLSSVPLQTKDSINQVINEVYAHKKFPKLKSLKKAQTLSYILPGTGQIYAGYFWEGAASASIQLAALAFTGYCVYVHYYIAAFVAGYSTFQKFYMGGINRLEYLVGKKNYELTRAYNDPLKEKILSIQEKVTQSL